MDDLRISDVAERTGFSAATLRYYEQIGLVTPAGRTDAGYRVYDERALTRLGFIGRAKHLGLALGEIRELADLWDGDRCPPVLDRLRRVLDDRRTAVRAQIAAARSAAELDAVAARLARAAPGDHPDGPCDDGCACVTGIDAARDPVPVPLAARGESDQLPGAPAAGPVEVACTLGPGEREARQAEWRAVAAEAAGREAVPGGVRLEFAAAPGLAPRLADLVEREGGCCAFFTFALGVAAGRVTLDVRAPAGAAALVAELVGEV